MRVQVEYFSSYNMPSVCVGCGNPVAAKTYEVSKSNTSGKQSVGLKFPVCEECFAASKVGPGWLGCLGGLLLAIVGAGIGATLGDSGGWLMIAGGFFGLIAGIWLSRKLAISNKSPEVQERISRLDKSVRITGFSLPTFGKGWIKLDFADAAYGTQFMQLNGGKA
jgi:hypothetical protein